jgi:hypothetical protein
MVLSQIVWIKSCPFKEINSIDNVQDDLLLRNFESQQQQMGDIMSPLSTSGTTTREGRVGIESCHFAVEVIHLVLRLFFFFPKLFITLVRIF